MLEAIHQKFPDFQAFDDLQWPLLTPDAPPAGPTRRLVLDNSDDSDDDGNISDGRPLKEYWDFIRQKYQSQNPDFAASSISQMAGLPPSWTVVHMSVTEDKSTLFLTRQQGGATGDPLVFCVPLKGRRDDGTGDEEDEHLTFEDALGELREIVRLSDEGTRGAVHIKDEASRANWWKVRGELDTRMKELLENIEFCWLGAFKVGIPPDETYRTC